MTIYSKYNTDSIVRFNPLPNSKINKRLHHSKVICKKKYLELIHPKTNKQI